jgi:hypothetical protein
MQEIKVVDLDEPAGWIYISLFPNDSKYVHSLITFVLLQSIFQETYNSDLDFSLELEP